MNNKLLLIGGLVVAGAVGAFLFLRNPASDSAPMMGDGKAQTMSASFAQLMALGENYTCTFDETDDAGNANSGTVYVADQGSKINGEFMMNQPDGTEIKTNVISDGDYNYIWMSNQAQGYKIAVSPEGNQLFPEGEEGEETGFDENEPVDFNCQPWRPDNSYFVPPTNIDFLDMSAQMEMMQQQLPAMDEGNDNLKCSACDQVPADSRAQCLTAMGC